MELTREPPQSCEILEQQQGDELDAEVYTCTVYMCTED